MSQQLIKGTQELVCELGRRITTGESFDNSKLKRLADQFFGGSRAKSVYTVRDAYNALEAAINKSLLEAAATKYSRAPLERLADLRALLHRLPTQTTRTAEQVEFQQFSTPPTIAFIAAQLLDLQPDDVVLEPPAGTGSLAIWPRSAGAKVICNEIDPRRRALLKDVLGFETFGLDAEMIDDILPQEIVPTAILMNPPFTGTGGRVVVHRNKYGFLHIEGALRRLREGGRLVAIASEALSFERPGAIGWWQKIARSYTSRDMKSLGMYGSASISFGIDPKSNKAVEYRERVHHLTPAQRKMYNGAALAWRVILQNIDRALAITNASRRARGLALNKFWGDHQRFFRQLICAFKVPSVVAETEDALRAGKSAVISLVGTGEAKTREQILRLAEEGGSLEDLDFSPREIIAAMVERGFPTQLYRDQTDPVSGRTIQVLATDESGAPIQSREALKMKQELLDKLSALHVPENPLDQLVNHFGEINVAEITGRTRRLIRDPRSGKVEYKKRAAEGVAMNRVNVHAMEQFQSGRCRVAIISDAGSMGISLHASNRAGNRQRRVHITHELGWSADKQMQCFGRTHRSDQAEPPEYVLLSTELGGEKRFSSTIARRLSSLGALTKGDRGAVDNADWARYNFETQEGKAALGLLYKRILEGESVPGLEDPRQTLRDIGLLVWVDGAEKIRKEDERNVPRFLNRILALEVEPQNALFDYFADLFDQTVRYAKATGTFDEGVTDIKALAIRVAKPSSVVHRDKVTGAETVLYTLEVDRPSAKVSFERADRLRESHHGAFLQHQSRGTFVLALPSGSHATRGRESRRPLQPDRVIKSGSRSSRPSNQVHHPSPAQRMRQEERKKYVDTDPGAGRADSAGAAHQHQSIEN